jgi:hypothetical protein
MKRDRWIATAIVALLAACPAQAANLSIAPLSSLNMILEPGRSGSTTIVGNTDLPPTMPCTMILHLQPAGGSMPSSWLTTRPMEFRNQTTQLLLPLTVTIPATASPGRYTVLVRPLVQFSSVSITPPLAPTEFSVTVTSACGAPPTVTVGSAQPAEFTSPNGRLADVAVAGGIVVPAGCTLARAWYTLSDEYGIFGTTEEIAAAADGSFGFTAPVQVSRRGDDRDGRSYRVTVFATDEAGLGSSAPAVIVVRHDQRKER